MNIAPAIAVTEPRWVRALLIALACAFLGVVLVLPLAVVVGEAFAKGFAPWSAALQQPDTLAALRLTLLAAAIAVPAI